MKWLLYTTAIAALTGCWGDNRAYQQAASPDAATGTEDVDAAIHVQHDAPEAPLDAHEVADAHEPADAAVSPPPSCALVPQDGCSGATPACDIAAADDGTVACRAVTKNGVSNSHCAAATDCRAGYTCVHDGSADDSPWCSRFCEVDTDCVGTGSRCLDEVADGTDEIPICTHACDPYEQSGCPSGMGCLAMTDPGGDYSDCAYMGTVDDGDTCATDEDCELGSTCVTQNGMSLCAPYCIVGEDGTCDSGTCQGFATALVLGGIEYGVCS